MSTSSTADQVRTRAFELAFDAQALRAAGDRRAVRASLSSDARLVRFGELEVLSHAPGAIVLDRAKDGLPLLIGHDASGIPVGAVTDLGTEGGRLRGLLSFGRGARAEEAWQAVQDQVLRSTSVRYRVLERQPIIEDGQNRGWLITRWELFEVSLVAVPFDHTVGVGRSFSAGVADMENENETGTAGEQARGAAGVGVEIVELCVRHQVADLAPDLLRRECTLEEARTAILDAVVRRDEQAGGHRNAAPVAWNGLSVTDRRGEPGDVLRDLSEALAARNGGPEPSERARQYMRMGTMEMARDLLERRGIRTTGMSVGQIFERSMGTTDLPVLLTGTGQRLLMQPYQVYTGGIRQIAKASTARDFRTKTMARLGEPPTLLKVNEHGEFKSGAMAEAKETYKVETFGRIVGLTRQAIVNDDLSSFADLSTRMGWAAMEFECAQLVALLTSNGGAGPTLDDGVALFHADHGNTPTTGAVIDVASLGAARLAMRVQKGLDQATPIDVRPRFLVVPAALETLAEKYLAEIAATTSSSVNPFGGKLVLIVDPRLDAIDAKRWYLAADPNQVPTIEYSYLESEEGPRMFIEEGFDVDGVRFKVRLDYGCGVLDYRGLYMNQGPAG